MISEETLLKKIENGETVWLIEQCVIEELKLPKYTTFVYGDFLNVDDKPWGVPLKNLFETKEKAEWELEFGNITRTERLELPEWEDLFNPKLIKANCLCGDDYFSWKYRDLEICKTKVDEALVLMVFNWRRTLKHRGDKWLWEDVGIVFQEPLTYENYIKACRLCKKLFSEGEK